MAWFRSREAQPKADPELARQLLSEAQSLRARGDLSAAQEAAKRALDAGIAALGERNPAVVPFLLVYAGLLNQAIGWSAGSIPPSPSAGRIPASRSSLIDAPSITRAAALASGVAVALDTNGTVRLARGFASST